MGMVTDFKVNIGNKEIIVKAPKLDLDGGLKELAEYLGKPCNDFKKELEKASGKFGGFGKYVKVTEDEWNSMKIDEDDINEVMGFYAQTENYMPELTIIASTEDKQKLCRFVIGYLLKENVKKIVDYGCGVGQISIIGALNGLDMTSVDIEGKTFEFTKWKFKKYGVNVKTIEIKNDKPLKEKYDAITCFEVLQHVPDVEKKLERFYESLNEKGLLLITRRFIGNYSLALKKNEKYEEIFEDVVKSKGFKLIEKVHMWGNKDNSGKWLEIYRKD